jgi:hypothetical protein
MVNDFTDVDFDPSKKARAERKARVANMTNNACTKLHRQYQASKAREGTILTERLQLRRLWRPREWCGGTCTEGLPRARARAGQTMVRSVGKQLVVDGPD